MKNSDKCPHKTLVRKNSGGLSWYVCANPDCDAPKVKGNPQKFKAVEWDGRIGALSPAPPEAYVDNLGVETVRYSVSPTGTGQPDAYLCPANCGCLWRDNHDGTMSLFGPKSSSCTTCETMSLDKLMPLYRAEIVARPIQSTEAKVSDEQRVSSVTPTIRPDQTAPVAPSPEELAREIVSNWFDVWWNSNDSNSHPYPKEYDEVKRIAKNAIEAYVSAMASSPDRAEELAREIEDAIDRYERGPNRAESYLTFRSDRCGVIAALLRSRMERAER